MTKYWLFKSEPESFSIDDLKRNGFTAWEGVRNYKARNYMRDDMKYGDLGLIYHSNAFPSGVAGICRVCREAFPDATALDPNSQYFDPKASSQKPIWMMVEVEFVEKFPHFISLPELRQFPELQDMPLLRKGQRLSILPIEHRHFEFIKELGRTVPQESKHVE